MCVARCDSQIDVEEMLTRALLCHECSYASSCRDIVFVGRSSLPLLRRHRYAQNLFEETEDHYAGCAAGFMNQIAVTLLWIHARDDPVRSLQAGVHVDVYQKSLCSNDFIVSVLSM